MARRRAFGFFAVLVVVAFGASACRLLFSFDYETSPSEGTRYAITGTVDGLAGATVALVLNGATPGITVGDGPFVISEAVADGMTFSLVVERNPEGHVCEVQNGRGRIQGADATGVVIHCPSTVGDAACDPAAFPVESVMLGSGVAQLASGGTTLSWRSGTGDTVGACDLGQCWQDGGTIVTKAAQELFPASDAGTTSTIVALGPASSGTFAVSAPPPGATFPNVLSYCDPAVLAAGGTCRQASPVLNPSSLSQTATPTGYAGLYSIGELVFGVWSCGTGACEGTAAPALIAKVPNVRIALGGTSSTWFWTENDALKVCAHPSCAPDDAGVSLVETVATNVRAFATSSKVIAYASSASNDVLVCSTWPCTPFTVVKTGASAPPAALAATDLRVYWIDSEKNAVFTCPVSGCDAGGPVRVLSPPAGDGHALASLAVDVGAVYASSAGTPAVLYRRRTACPP